MKAPGECGVRAVIFDLDGLLIDTETMARRSFHFALNQLGRQVDEAFFLSLIGLTASDSDAMISARFGADFPMAEYKTHTRAFFEQELSSSGIPVKAGAVRLLEWLHASNVPLALATSSRTDRAHFKLEVAGLAGYFDVVIGGDQVERGKPAPDIFARASGALLTAPAQCVTFEDSFNGVRAAHAAGTVPVMVPDLLQPPAEITALTHCVLASLVDAPALLSDWLSVPLPATRGSTD